MTAYNNHVLSQGALDTARESAAKEQREKDAALLRRLADEGDAQGARWDDSAALLKTYGHADEAASDARIAETHRAVAAILRAAAIEIEAGEQ